MGDPIGTVYLLPRTGKDKTGRVYDKGREMRDRIRGSESNELPEPYALIRVESVQRFKPEQVALDWVALIARASWERRFITLVPDRGGRSVVVPFDGCGNASSSW